MNVESIIIVIYSSHIYETFIIFQALWQVPWLKKTKRRSHGCCLQKVYKPTLCTLRLRYLDSKYKKKILTKEIKTTIVLWLARETISKMVSRTQIIISGRFNNNRVSITIIFKISYIFNFLITHFYVCIPLKIHMLNP